MVIGERLRAIREHKDMSQGDVEHRTGLLRSYVSRVENGHTIPSIETLEKWSQALGVSMGELFSEGGKEPRTVVLPAPTTVKPDRKSANALRRISQALQRISPKDRILLVDFARKLAARGQRPANAKS